MKKQLAIVVVFLLPGIVSAQEFMWGAKAGLNLAKLNYSVGGYSGSSDDLFSFHAGFYGKLMTSEKFGIQPEFLFSGQGGGGDAGDINLMYINIPAMASFMFTPGVSVQAGPQIGFLLSASANGTDVKSIMNSIDFGAGFGLVVERPNGLSFNFRYNIGFTNTLSSSAASSLLGLGIGMVTITNQVTQFSVGYRLSTAP